MDNDKGKINNTGVDADELDIAKQKAEEAKQKMETAGYTYTHTFRKPFTYMNKTYTELRFDWDSLTGQDGLSIEAELQALGTPVVVPAFSGAYLIRMAAKACTEKIGSDAFELMSLADYNRVRSAARSFLLISE